MSSTQLYTAKLYFIDEHIRSCRTIYSETLTVPRRGRRVAESLSERGKAQSRWPIEGGLFCAWLVAVKVVQNDTAREQQLRLTLDVERSETIGH